MPTAPHNAYLTMYLCVIILVSCIFLAVIISRAAFISSSVVERSIITRKDTDGLELRFGNSDVAVALPRLISMRKGIGDTLAEGAARASNKIGRNSDTYAMHVKGQEYPGYDPRGSFGMALAYATSDRGADHNIRHILCRVNHPQTNGKLERFYGVHDQKRHQFKTIDEYVHWHNEIKPHLSLNIETLETPIQAFQRKLSPEKPETIQTIQDAK